MSIFQANNNMKLIPSGQTTTDNHGNLEVFPYGNHSRIYKWDSASPQGWYERLDKGLYQYEDTLVGYSATLSDDAVKSIPDLAYKIDDNYVVPTGMASNDPLMVERLTNIVPFPDIEANVYDTFKRGRQKVGYEYVGNSGTTFSRAVMVNGVCWFESGKGRWITPYEYYNYKDHPDSSDPTLPGQPDDYTITASNDRQAYSTPYIWDQRSLGHYIPQGTTSMTNGQHGIVAYGDMVWGETADGEWFTESEYYDSGSGINELFDVKSDPIQVPILAYHDFTGDASTVGDYTMLFDEFTKQLDWLTQLGYTIITMAQAYEMLKTNQNSIGKVAVLTFDDGYTSWRQIDSILTERNFSGMFFWAGDNLQANSNIATQLVADGFETGNHTAHHMAMGDGQYWPQWAAWNNNKDALSNLNTEINFCAYPFGSHNYLSPMVCKNNDYLACLNFDNKVATAFSSDFDRFTLGRLEMISGQHDDSIDTFADYLQNGDVQY